MRVSTLDLFDSQELEIEGPKFVLLTTIVRIFGGSREPKFYKQRFIELVKFIACDFGDEIEFQVSDSLIKRVSVVPTNDFDKWNFLHSELSKLEYDVIHTLAIIEHITRYDIRTALALLFVFGLLDVKNIEAFNRFFWTTGNFVNYYSVQGITYLVRDLKAGRVTGFTEAKIDSITYFYSCLKGFDHRRLLRNSNGSLIPSGTVTYNLALTLTANQAVDLSVLNDAQKRVLDLFIQDYENDGIFATYADIAKEFGSSTMLVKKLLTEVLAKISPDEQGLANIHEG